VRSIIVLSGMEMRRCNDTDPGDLKIDEVAMRDFIMTEGCRNKVMSGYLNGLSLDCMEIGGELCDCCAADSSDVLVRGKRRLEDEEGLAVVRKVRMVEGRGSDVQGAVREKAGMWEMIDSHLEGFRNGCCVCWTLNGWDVADHKFEECLEISELIGGSGFEVWRRDNIRLFCILVDCY
jgi:hypothetical protein